MRPVRYRRSKYWWAASVFRVLKPIWRHAWTFLTIATIIFFIAAWGHTWSTQPWRPYWTPYVQKGWEGKQWDKNIYASVEDETGATSYRCSMVAGTAFFQAVGVDLSPYVGDLLILTDSTGKQAYGYIKAAGGGETLGTEIIAAADDRTFASDTGWWTQQGTTIAAGVCSFDAPQYNGLYRVAVTLVTNALYKGTATISNYVDGNLAMVCYEKVSPTVTGDGAKTFYVTSNGTSTIRWNQRAALTGTFDLDDVSIKQVTDCAVTGVHIVSTPNGSTQSWASITSGFNPNDAAMTFDIYETGNLP